MLSPLEIFIRNALEKQKIMIEKKAKADERKRIEE